MQPRPRTTKELRAIHAKQTQPRAAAPRRSRGHRVSGYTLYSTQVKLGDGKCHTRYFFSRGRPKSGEPADLPPGYEAFRAPSGLPMLRRRT